jgi:hypothetical protein
MAIVLDYKVTVKGSTITPGNRFSLVESPFLKLTTLCKSLGEDNDAIDDATHTVD